MVADRRSDPIGAARAPGNRYTSFEPALEGSRL